MTIQYLEKRIEELEKRVKALEQEPCDDAVSRQAIKKLKRHNLVEGQFVSLYDIERLPSVRPQEPKTGHWIYTEYHTWCCSECGGNPHKGTGFVPSNDEMKKQWKYCNLCGAKMVEPQESEDKDETDN